MFGKRGADKIISVYWFAILGIVAGGIFLMVYIFYNAPMDVRELEAGILANKIADCISEKGELIEGVLENSESDFFERCHLAFDEEYYSEADFFGVGNLEEPEFVFNKGNGELKEDCVEENNVRTRCLKKRMYVFDSENGKQWLVEILAAVKKAGENAR